MTNLNLKVDYQMRHPEEEYKWVHLCFRHASIMTVTEGKEIEVEVVNEDDERGYYGEDRSCYLCRKERGW